MELFEIIKPNTVECDHCDYVVNDIPDGEMHTYIDMSCPECGHNLLTREDYQGMITLINAIDKLNAVIQNNPDDISMVVGQLTIDELISLADVFGQITNAVDPSIDIAGSCEVSAQIKSHNGNTVSSVTILGARAAEEE